MNTLKPCPFCGSKNIESWESENLNKHEMIWCVFCVDCKCEGPESLVEVEAIQLWNNRV